MALGLVSLACGLLLVQLASVEDRWVVFVGGGSILAVVAVVIDVRRALLAYFILGLSIDAHYYLTPPPLTAATGNTSPGALSIPLAVVPGIALLALRKMSDLGGPGLRFFPGFGVPALMVVATATMATLLSSMWFIGFCVVWQLAALYVLFLVTSNEVRSDRDAESVLKLLMVVLLGQCAVFLLQLVTGIKFNAVGRVVSEASADMWHQATGTAAITTAGFACFLQPLVAVAYAKARTVDVARGRGIYRALAALGAMVIVLTLNRSSFAGLGIGIATTELLLRGRGMVRQRINVGRMLVSGTVLAVVLVAGFLMVQSQRATSFSADLDQRLALMQPGFSMIRENPVFGVGPGVYAYQLQSHAADHEGWLYISHNDYLLLWAERGLVGLLAWLVWARAMFRLTLAPTPNASRAVMGIGAAGGFAAHMWEIFWTACMSFPAYGIIFVLAGLCAGQAGSRQAEREPSEGEERELAVGTAA